MKLVKQDRLSLQQILFEFIEEPIVFCMQKLLKIVWQRQKLNNSDFSLDSESFAHKVLKRTPSMLEKTFDKWRRIWY